MLPKTSVYVKRYDVETKWMQFMIKVDSLLKKVIFRIKSALILKK